MRTPWLDVESQVVLALERHGGLPLDEMDLLMYRKALEPLMVAIWEGKLSAQAGPVWQVLFGIRNLDRRPRPEQVGEMVKKALRIAEAAAPMEARNVVRAPMPPTRQLPSKEGPPGAWIDHLPPSGDRDRDALMVKFLCGLEREIGASQAAQCARALASSRERLAREREEQRRQLLSAIPEEERDDFLARAGGDAARAVSLFAARERRREAASASARWKERWERDR